MEKVRDASVQALEPRTPGRKSKPVSQQELEALAAQSASQEKEISQWKTKWEVTRTVLDLERKAARGELQSGEGKKNRLSCPLCGSLNHPQFDLTGERQGYAADASAKKVVSVSQCPEINTVTAFEALAQR